MHVLDFVLHHHGGIEAALVNALPPLLYDVWMGGIAYFKCLCGEVDSLGVKPECKRDDKIKRDVQLPSFFKLPYNPIGNGANKQSEGKALYSLPLKPGPYFL